VPSSISNSRERAPVTRWATTWVVAVTLFLGVIALAELSWRSYGMRPTVTDDTTLWAVERERLEGQDNGQITALLGASRMQLDFSHESFHRLAPKHELINLSVAGKQPMAALRDIAEHSSFNGLLLVSVTASSLSDTMYEQQPWVDRYHAGVTWNTILNARLRAFVQSSLVVATSPLNLTKLFQRLLWQQGPPRINHYVTLPNRSRLANFSLTDISEHRRQRIAKLSKRATSPTGTDRAWLEHVASVEAWVDAIQARGGHVVFIRFPTSDAHWKIDEYNYPRRLYWDRWAAQSKAEFIHFKDVAGMDKFKLPDTSHLDEKDAPEFTRILVAEIRKRGLLP
jgi:hypothetical protein